MSPLQLVYWVFYGGAFWLALYLGTNAINSHTPPGAFLIEFFVLPVGFVLLVIDIVRNKPNTLKKLLVHIVGLSANWVIMAYMLIIYFR
jgi:hypothetical protein